MNKMLGYLKDYKRESVLAPLFKMLEATFDLFVPLVMADIVNIGIAAHDFHYILVRCGILLLLAMIGLACSLTAQYFSAKAAVGYSTALRHALFEHIQTLSFTEMDTLGTPVPAQPVRGDRCHGHGLYGEFPCSADLCSDHPAAERGGVRHHGCYPAPVQDGTESP